MNYTEVNFTIVPHSEVIADVLIAELESIGYDGFSYTDKGFCAYIPTQNYERKLLDGLQMLQYFSEQTNISVETREIEDQNWNKVWEENFTPIVVDNRIQIRAGFHAPIPGIEYEILIEPKMSFGTGHHATTVLMLRTILEMAETFEGKRVLDMGCGTGILSIMAAKVGAKEVIGIDIDDWAYHNAMENIQNNQVKHIAIKIGDASLLKKEQPFEVILANINRNILLNDMEHYLQVLQPQGHLIMSGFYLKDLPMIQERATTLGLCFEKYNEEQEWVSAVFYKK